MRRLFFSCLQLWLVLFLAGCGGSEGDFVFSQAPDGFPPTTTVELPLESLSIAPSSRSIAAGTSTAFTVTGLFADGHSLDLTSAAVWTSSQSSVARVEGGVATGLAPGSTSVVARYGGRQVEASLVVTQASLVSLEISPDSPAIAKGTEVALMVEGFFSDGSFQDITDDVTWSSSAPNVVDGAARALTTGQTTLTAALQGVADNTILTVTDARLTRLEISEGAGSLAQGTETRFVATGTFSDGSLQPGGNLQVRHGVGSTHPSRRHAHTSTGLGCQPKPTGARLREHIQPGDPGGGGRPAVSRHHRR